MPGASDEEMLAALKDSVEMLAAPAETQVAWLHAKGFPVDELALQLDDEVPGWLALLRRACSRSTPRMRSLRFMMSLEYSADLPTPLTPRTGRRMRFIKASSGNESASWPRTR